MSATTATHTPGPWANDNDAIYSEPLDEVVMVAVEGKEPRSHHTALVALVYGHHIGDAHHYTHDDNSRLIATAPELLEALSTLCAVFNQYGLTDTEKAALECARAAIAKAEGR